MWFIKLLSKLFKKNQFEILRQTAQNSSQFDPQRKLCEQLLGELSIELYGNYQATNGINKIIKPVYPNIEIYTAKLKEIARAVSKDVALPTTWGIAVESNVSVDGFLISKDGYYLNPQEAIKSFKEAACQLCSAMEKSDTATYGVHEHNLRILTKIFVNLRKITIALIEVTLS